MRVARAIGLFCLGLAVLVTVAVLGPGYFRQATWPLTPTEMPPSPEGLRAWTELERQGRLHCDQPIQSLVPRIRRGERFPMTCVFEEKPWKWISQTFDVRGCPGAAIELVSWRGRLGRWFEFDRGDMVGVMYTELPPADRYNLCTTKTLDHSASVGGE